jgi:hypothetical protein
MENYLLKSSISLIILYGLYRIMLRYEFNHQLNRFIGLTCVLFSISFPFVPITDLSQARHLPGTFYAVAAGTADLQDNFSSMISKKNLDIFLLVYGIGACAFLVRLLIGLVTLLRLYFHSPKSNRCGFKVVTLSKKMSPFTFFNMLVIGNNPIEDSEMDAMLLHERAHRDQYHSIDAVLLEALTVIFWFNPVIWFFQKDIKAQHEYFADEQVLAKGINPLAYQLVLFKARTGTSMELANHLSNKTSLTKRFNMMAKTRSNSKTGYWRASLFLALMAVILFFSAFSGRPEEIKVDKTATYEQGEQAMYQTITKQIRYPASARSENRSGLVQVSFTVDEKGNVGNVEATAGNVGSVMKEVVVVGYTSSSASAKGIDDVLKAECVHVVESLGKFIPAQKGGKSVSSVLTLPVKFKLK